MHYKIVWMVFLLGFALSIDSESIEQSDSDSRIFVLKETGSRIFLHTGSLDELEEFIKSASPRTTFGVLLDSRLEAAETPQDYIAFAYDDRMFSTIVKVMRRGFYVGNRDLIVVGKRELLDPKAAGHFANRIFFCTFSDPFEYVAADCLKSGDAKRLSKVIIAYAKAEGS